MNFSAPYCRESKVQHPTCRVVGIPKYAPDFSCCCQLFFSKFFYQQNMQHCNISGSRLHILFQVSIYNIALELLANSVSKLYPIPILIILQMTFSYFSRLVCKRRTFFTCELFLHKADFYLPHAGIDFQS